MALLQVFNSVDWGSWEVKLKSASSRAAAPVQELADDFAGSRAAAVFQELAEDFAAALLWERAPRDEPIDGGATLAEASSLQEEVRTLGAHEDLAQAGGVRNLSEIGALSLLGKGSLEDGLAAQRLAAVCSDLAKDLLDLLQSAFGGTFVPIGVLSQGACALLVGSFGGKLALASPVLVLAGFVPPMNAMSVLRVTVAWAMGYFAIRVVSRPVANSILVPAGLVLSLGLSAAAQVALAIHWPIAIALPSCFPPQHAPLVWPMLPSLITMPLQAMAVSTRLTGSALESLPAVASATTLAAASVGILSTRPLPSLVIAGVSYMNLSCYFEGQQAHCGRQWVDLFVFCSALHTAVASAGSMGVPTDSLLVMQAILDLLSQAGVSHLATKKQERPHARGPARRGVSARGDLAEPLAEPGQ